MRILLASTAAFVPPRGGSTRSNRVWLEALAKQGHACKVMCGTPAVQNRAQRQRVAQEIESQGYSLTQAGDDADLDLPSGISVCLRRDLARRPGLLAGAIRSFEPDWVLVSSEDLSHSLLTEATATSPGRVVYLAHTPQFFPFGPESWSPDTRATDRVRDCAAVVVIGHHMRHYVQEHLGCDAHVIHPNLYGEPPFEHYRNFDADWVLMVNPCAVKGLSLFLNIARGMPHLAFAALPGWGTTAADREEIGAMSNMTLLQPVHRIEQVLRRTRVMLMPSLWYEGFGLIAMEAMLRGIPVVASSSGGLIEAKRNTGFVIPVNPIREYRAAFDEVHMPIPVIAQQNAAPWHDALQALVSDQAIYEREAEDSRAAALHFVNGLSKGAMEALLLSLQPQHPRAIPNWKERMDRLSPEQRERLLRELRASRARD